MEEQSVADRVSELENRIGYLEREFGASYKEHTFKRTVGSLFSDEADIEYQDGHYGQFARVTEINGDDVQRAIDRLEGRDSDLGHAVTETANGLGMEVYTEYR